MPDSQATTTSRALSIYSKLVFFSVLILIFFGALVTSNNAGLTVPDWPTSFKYNMFLFPPSLWVGGIFYEHVHRLIASTVGFLTLVLAIWTQLVEKRRFVRILTWVALLVVILQGLLGGLTVLYLLPLAISAGHAVLAQTFLLITLVIAYFHSVEFQENQNKTQANNLAPKNSEIFLISRLTILGLGFLYLQLIVGALMRHSESGLAVLDFPLIAGNIIPDFSAEGLAKVNLLRASSHLPAVTLAQMLIHVMHRFLGLSIFGLLVALGWRAFKQKQIKKLKTVGAAVLLLVSVQFALGALTVLTGRHPLITSLHVACGALLLALTMLLFLRLGPQQR